jgi:hypothetical protein
MVEKTVAAALCKASPAVPRQIFDSCKDPCGPRQPGVTKGSKAGITHDFVVDPSRLAAWMGWEAPFNHLHWLAAISIRV